MESSEASNFSFKNQRRHIVWWRWRESNPRPKALDARYYMLSSPLNLVPRQHDVRGASKDQSALFNPYRRTAISGDPVIMTLHPRAQAQVGSGLGLKRPERSCRRWQL